VNIAREQLIELARRETEQRAASDEILSGYLIGSVARGNPSLGDVMDIDLVLIHRHDPAYGREVVRLSHQVHLDILHHSRMLYDRPSRLRVDPWMGPALCEPIFLYDPEHFFEWAQAGARGQFFRPDHVHARAQAFLACSRQASSLLPLSDRWLRTFLRALLDAANAVASLDGFPVAGRRISLHLAEIATRLECPWLLAQFHQLLGAEHLHRFDLPQHLNAWARACDAAIASGRDPTLLPCRRDYYLRAFQALADAGRGAAILWNLLWTWEEFIHLLGHEPGAQPHRDAWRQALKELGLGPEQRGARAQSLKGIIQKHTAFIETWGERHGA